jgi:hypothetical protein
MKFMYQFNYIYFINFRNLPIEMHVVHPMQVIVVGTVRRPTDAVVLQILELIPKVHGSSMSQCVLEQVSGRPFDTIWRPQLRVGTAKWRLLNSTPAPSIKYEQNMIFSIEVSNNDLPRSPDRESCPRPHLASPSTRQLVDEISTSLVATSQQALSGVIYLTNNHP